MKTHSHLASRFFGILAMVAVGWLQPTAVSGQTPELTVIDNIATVSFTDANSNFYSTVQDNVTVTVGFVVGLSVVASQPTATPASPSTLNTMSFVVNNIGNGTDSVTVTDNISDGTVITVITNYIHNATPYSTLALLNAALAGTAIAQGGSETITVEYTIGSNKGGQPSTYTLTATSRRDVGEVRNDITLVTPGWTGTVATTPKGSQSLSHLPSGGASPNYTFTFNVANNQNGSDDFNLVATSPGSPVITIVSVNGVGGASTTINLAASANQNIDVVYSVATAAAAGAQDTLYLAATSVANGTVNDSGFADLTVVKASLTIVKEAYRDNQTTLLGGGDTVLPGEFIQYKVTVANGGTAPASSVHVDDLLPSELTYISATEDAPTWTFTTSGNDLDADLTGTLAPAASRFFWIRVQVN